MHDLGHSIGTAVGKISTVNRNSFNFISRLTVPHADSTILLSMLRMLQHDVRHTQMKLQKRFSQLTLQPRIPVHQPPVDPHLQVHGKRVIVIRCKRGRSNERPALLAATKVLNPIQ